MDSIKPKHVGRLKEIKNVQVDWKYHRIRPDHGHFFLT